MESRTVEDNISAAEQIVELPIEVHEHIIKSLDNKRSAGTIANCALVCRRWLPCSRFKLYYDVNISYRRQWTAFAHLMALSGSSRVVGYLRLVRELRISPEDAKFHDKAQKRPRIGWRKGQERPWAHTVLVQCAAYLSGLYCITLHNVDWSQAHHVRMLRSGSTYRSLTTLVLSDCTFSSVRHLHIFVTAWPALSDLTLNRVDLKSLDRLSNIAKGGHSLKCLKLQNRNHVIPTISQWLSIAQFVQGLEVLEWRTAWEDHLTGKAAPADDKWETVTKAIGAGGPSLQELVFDVHLSWKVDLSCFTHLRSLTLHYMMWSFEGHLMSLERVLSSISSDQLEELSLVHFPGMCFFNTILTGLTHFKIIDDILASPRFARLRRVSIKYVFHTYDFLGPVTRSKSPQSTPSSSPEDAPIPAPSPSEPNPSGRLDSSQSLSRNLMYQMKFLAKHIIRCTIQEELKQLHARGILEVQLSVTLHEQ